MGICGTEEDREGHNQEGYYNFMNIIRKKGGVTVTLFATFEESRSQYIIHLFLSYDTLYCHTVWISTGILDNKDGVSSLYDSVKFSEQGWAVRM